jgi:hypothetical protein
MKQSLGNEGIRHLVEVLRSGRYPLFTSKDNEFFKKINTLPQDIARREFRKVMRRARSRARQLAKCLEE